MPVVSVATTGAGRSVWVNPERRIWEGEPMRPVLVFSRDLPRQLIVAQPDEARMTEMIVRRPLDELELADEHRLQPAAFGHLGHRESLPPAAAFRLRQIGEWTLRNLERLELPGQLIA